MKNDVSSWGPVYLVDTRSRKMYDILCWSSKPSRPKGTIRPGNGIKLASTNTSFLPCTWAYLLTRWWFLFIPCSNVSWLFVPLRSWDTISRTWFTCVEYHRRRIECFDPIRLKEQNALKNFIDWSHAIYVAVECCNQFWQRDGKSTTGKLLTCEQIPRTRTWNRFHINETGTSSPVALDSSHPKAFALRRRRKHNPIHPINRLSMSKLAPAENGFVNQWKRPIFALQIVALEIELNETATRGNCKTSFVQHLYSSIKRYTTWPPKCLQLQKYFCVISGKRTTDDKCVIHSTMNAHNFCRYLSLFEWLEQ